MHIGIYVFECKIPALEHLNQLFMLLLIKNSDPIIFHSEKSMAPGCVSDNGVEVDTSTVDPAWKISKRNKRTEPS